jgi:hypothetical protein
MGERRAVKEESSSGDEAPEAITLTESKATALEALRAAKDASVTQSRTVREQRRAQDTLFKTQAEERKKRVAAVLAQLSTGRKKNTKDLTIVQPTKTIFGEDDGEEERERDEIVEVGPGTKVVLLKEKRVTRANVSAARELVRNREEMQLSRNARTRVHASTSRASRRVGRPASQFVLSPVDRERLAQKYVKKNRKKEGKE